MTTSAKTKITVEATINAPVEKVWAYWTTPEHITQWNAASADWCSPHAVNDLRAGGRFVFRMEARDGSMGFDFEGVYDKVIQHEQIDYTIADGRSVSILFQPDGDKTTVTETFEAEDIHSI